MNSVPLSPSVRAKVQKFVKDGELTLSSGSIKGLVKQKNLLEPAVVQLTKLKFDKTDIGTCARADLFDGCYVYKHVRFSENVAEQLKTDGIVGLTTEPGHGTEILLISKMEFLKETDTGSPIFVITEYDLLAKGVPLMNGHGKEHSGTPEAVEMLDKLLRDFPADNSCSIPFDITDVNSSPSIPAGSRSTYNTPTKSPRKRSAPVTPIAEVVPYGIRQRICGLCISTDFRSTAKGGTVFSFVLIDEKQTSIRIVGFNDSASKAHELVKENNVYYVSGGRVQKAEKKFNTTGHDFEITLRPDSEILLCTDVVISPPPLSLKVCPLKRICDFKDRQVDILAIIDVMEPVTDFTSRAGTDHTKRDLYLLDESGELVQFTLWKTQAVQFEENARGMAIGIQGAVVKLWTGGYTLSALPGVTKWELCPDLPEVRKLYKWYNGRQNLSQTNSQASTIEGEVLIRDLPTSQDSQGLDDREIKVNASITSIQHMKCQTCPKENCQNKVLQVDNSFYCQQCDSTTDTFKWSTTVTMELTDCSGSVSVKALEETAAKISGMYSQQRDPQNSNNHALPKPADGERLKKFIFSLYPAPIAEGEKNDVRYHVLDVKEINLERYFTELEKTVENALR